MGQAATEGIVEVEDQAGMEDIMVEAISTEVPASTSVGTLGSPTTIPTGIILPPIITRTLITILINRKKMALTGLF